MKIKLNICLISSLLLFFVASCKYFNQSDIERALDRYNRKMLQALYVSEAGYAETAKCDGTYCMYTEAYGYLFSAGYEVPVPVDNIFLFPANMKKSDRSESWLSHRQNLYANSEISFQSDYPPGFLSALNAFRWFEERVLFNKLEGFDINLADTVQTKNELVKIYSFGNHELYGYTGNIHVSSKVGYIKKIRFDKIRFHSQPLFDWVQASGYITFYNNERSDRLKSIHINHKTSQFNYNVYLHVDKEYISQEQIEDSRVFRLMEHKRRPFVYYDKEAWKNPFDFEKINKEEIYADLGGLSKINVQFERNSGILYVNEQRDINGNTVALKDSLQTYSFIEQKIEEVSTLFY